MTKQEVHQFFIDQLMEELAALTEAAKNTIAMATDSEHVAKSKYETFSLESSYLARGQARRVEELTEALDRLKALPLKALDSHAPVQLGALVRLASRAGEKQTVFVAPGGGGEQITAGGEDIMIITPVAPLGRALLGKTSGDKFEIEQGAEVQALTVLSVE